MIETYKIVHNIYDKLTTKTLFKKNDCITRTNSKKLFKPHCVTKKFQHFFSNRIINTWNSLPERIVNAESLNVFKNTLDRYWGDLKFMIVTDEFQNV